MSIHNGDAPDRDLHDRAAAVARPRREANLVARCLELAGATRVNDRAWGLVRLAADLRALGEPNRALFVLDTPGSSSLRPRQSARSRLLPSHVTATWARI